MNHIISSNLFPFINSGFDEYLYELFLENPLNTSKLHNKKLAFIFSAFFKQNFRCFFNFLILEGEMSD